ncbi:hypothetical protein HK096_004980 [Nowakowskiella sp. JEL0078]|nr:hypothetical protein HK096_004980 [Nowakowskiella sp. JEL0078]
MSLPRILVTRRLLPRTQKLLESYKNFELIQWDHEDSSIPRDKLLEIAREGIDGIVVIGAKIDREFLDAAGSRLKVVSTHSAGYDHIDVTLCKARNIKVGSTPQVVDNATADLTVALLLIASRKLSPAIDAVKNGGWGIYSPRPFWLSGSEIGGKTVGFVGFGGIAQAVAERLVPFKIGKIIFNTPSIKAPYKFSSSNGNTTYTLIAEQVSFEELLSQSDVVIVLCSLTNSTKNLFNAEAFSKMKDSSIFINAARGGIVDQDALIDALKRNRSRTNSEFANGFGGPALAGLDVTVPEPLGVDSELLKLDNCVVVPHVGTATIETREKMGELTILNCLGALGLNGSIGMPAELKI